MEVENLTNEFIWSELLLYIIPIVVIVSVQRYGQDYLKFFEEFPLNLSIVLIPLWLVLIHLFSVLIFSFSLLPYILFMATFLLALHLYDYIRRVNVFTFRAYYEPASARLFLILTAFLIGLIILRFYTYFFL